MVNVRYLEANWKGRGITPLDVDFVMRSTISAEEEMSDGVGGTLRVMFVGYTQSARLLEVGVEYLDDQEELVFHADDATPYYENLFREVNQ
jgi:hypothetical protein